MLHYDDETIVVKYGGHAMGEEEPRAVSPATWCCSSRPAINPVVVHGGGPQIDAMLKKLGIKSQFADGLRVTDQATVEIVEMVLAGSINKQIVGYINDAGGIAIGLCGKDGNMVHGAQGDAHRGRSGFRHREGGRSRLRRRAGKVDLTVLNQVLGKRHHPGAGAGGASAGRRDLQRQRRHLRRRHRRRAQGQAPAVADRRARRARQGREPDPRIDGRRGARPASPTAPSPAA